MSKHTLLDDDAVWAWIVEHNPDGAEKLGFALHAGQITGEEALVCTRFLRTHAALKEAAEKAMKDTMYVRSVQAAEKSARWAFWAFVVALGALALSLWQMLRG